MESWVVRWNEVDFVGFNSSRQLKRAVELIRTNALDGRECSGVSRIILMELKYLLPLSCSNNYLNKQKRKLDKPILVAIADT